MPIYEYACGACGHTFEEWQKMSDPPVKTCPKCKKKKVEKLISQTAFQLKGGGWYKDLYSSSKATSAAKESGGGDVGASGGSAGSEPSGNKDSASGGKDSSKESTSSKDSKESKSSKGDVKDAKKKDSPKKSDTRAA